MTKLPLLSDWKVLKNEIGWPYGRTHTDRLEDQEKDPFPRRIKLGDGRGARIVWPTHDVVEWLRRRKVPIKEVVLV
jgi:predicted DNA-binding transcriptional regulator AlpA